jgi:hypothetical protein
MVCRKLTADSPPPPLTPARRREGGTCLPLPLAVLPPLLCGREVTESNEAERVELTTDD